MILQIKAALRIEAGFVTPRVAWAWLLAVAMLPSLAPTALAEERVPAEGRVIKLTLPLETGQVSGTVTSYTQLTFTLTTEQGTPHRVLWNAILADKVELYWRYLEKPEGNAKAMFELGDLLIRHREGEARAKQAFDRALELDPGLADAVALSLANQEPDGTPRYVGTADEKMWGELSDQTMQQGIETLRSFAQRTQRELQTDLQLYESERFMLLTDVEIKEVEALSATLSKAYQAVAEVLDKDPTENVFVGKCLIVLFKRRVDYIRFQDQLHDTDARGTGGLCHGFGNGHVHIASFQRRNARQTRHVVIHELVHAYLHRHEGPRPLDDWVNEGLAEHLAHRIVPPAGENLYLKARLLLEGKKGLGDGFYEGENLQAWQYDIAGALTGYLLERSEKAYPKLIKAVKQGTPTDEALQSVYRMTPAKLTLRFKQRLDRELNKKLGG
ncbi:MAG: basic secretory family protein [Phycisphaeraceae bacterium]|nr:basic secretory family protein [Phycisphaeraceae bacterium]